MDPTPVTLGLVVVALGVAAAAIGIVIWLYARFGKERELTLLQTEAKIATALLEAKLYMAETYMTKASASVVNDRLASEVHGMRLELGARLMRIENRIMQGFAAPAKLDPE